MIPASLLIAAASGQAPVATNSWVCCAAGADVLQVAVVDVDVDAMGAEVPAEQPAVNETVRRAEATVLRTAST